MLRKPTRLLAPCLSVLLLTSATAWADSEGAPGRVTAVSINAKGSDDASKARGEIELRAGSPKSKHLTKQTYQFGGSTCPGKDLSDAEIQMLVAAMNERAVVRPRYKNGQGGAKCLVGFTLGPAMGGKH